MFVNHLHSIVFAGAFLGSNLLYKCILLRIDLSFHSLWQFFLPESKTLENQEKSPQIVLIFHPDDEWPRCRSSVLPGSSFFSDQGRKKEDQFFELTCEIGTELVFFYVVGMNISPRRHQKFFPILFVSQPGTIIAIVFVIPAIFPKSFAAAKDGRWFTARMSSRVYLYIRR